MSMMTKSIGKVKWRILTRTSSTTPYGLVIDQSGSWGIILVGSIFRFPILLHIDKGIKLMLAPKSMRSFPTNSYLMVQGIVTLQGSLNFSGNFLCITALHLPLTTMLSLSMYFPFLVRMPFMNLV